MAEVKSIPIGVQELREILDYNPETGLFYWRISIGKKIKDGDIAGSLSKSKGYLIITYKSQKYKAHRLAWIHMNGEIPDGLFIDHEDMNRSNNKLVNLRLCTRAENMRNVTLRRDNTSGFKGIHYCNKSKLWIAAAKINGLTRTIGRYLTPVEASTAYQDFCGDCYGEFYRGTVS